MMKVTEYPEIEYYKGETIKPDGKKCNRTYLTKEFIERTYIQLGMSFDQIQDYYKLSYKIFYQSYRRWYTVQERKKIGGGKIAVNQRNRNSNRFNAGKPRCLLNKEVLLEYIEKKYAIEKMACLEKVAPQTIKKNLEYYKITNTIVKYGIDYERVITAKAIDEILGTSIMKGIEMASTNIQAPEVEQMLEDLTVAQLRLNQLILTIKKTRGAVMDRFARRGIKPSRSYKLPTSQTNKLAYDILEELEYEVECEYQIENRFYDFRIVNTNILIEIDAEGYHGTEEQIKNDEYKNNLAKENGYRVLRVLSGKSDKRVTLKRKIEACLSHLK